MQRFCDGCRRTHDLTAFDLDRDVANAVCRTHTRKQERAARAGARRQQLLKIQDLEKRRRALIAALVKIDKQIAREHALQVAPAPLIQHGETEDIFGSDGDLESGD